MRSISILRDTKGVALPVTLVVMLLLLVIGAAAMMMSQLGYSSISINARYIISDKNADRGIRDSIERMIGGTRCGFSDSYSGTLGSISITTVRAGNTCFISSQGSFMNAKVVKIAAVYLGGSSMYGPVIFKNLKNLSLGGSGAIASCDSECVTPALIIGNSLTNPPTQNQVTSCPNNPQNLVALTSPYMPNAFDQDTTDLTGEIFNDIGNRTALLNRLSSDYGVVFDNGTPLSFNSTNQCNLNSLNINEWTVSNNKIINRTGNISVEISWSGGNFIVKQGSSVICQNRNVYLGQNSKLTIDSSLNVGGGIAANEIVFKSNSSNATFVARNRIEISDNNLTIQNVNMFAQNYSITANGLNLHGGIIYSGGMGVGNLDINLKSNSFLGSSQNPVLILSDNNIKIQRNGNADIYGLIFATDQNNNFEIGSGNGNFKINGVVVSNSKNNNNINISGNFEIHFNKDAINKLSERLSFVKRPPCGLGSIRYSLQNTKMTVY